MINRTEAEERTHLEHVKRKLAEALRRVDSRVRRYDADVKEQKRHMWENKGDMDHVEKVSARQSAHELMLSAEAVAAIRRRTEKLLQSPYFGRFDFIKRGDESAAVPVYVGVHGFSDDADGGANPIFDWRAPISTMFYDYEIGEARYRAPSGDVAGEIVAKRQFRIRRGQMEFMLESGLNILDDVLQEELSRTSDDRMKTIVATIQRDQNAIIRNEDAEVLIIQGVAGSGKTSIALHRVAFLLYRFKESLASKDVLIISPNKVFADFISNVLPELGEEQIPEIEMEGLARALLDETSSFQTLLEQSAAVVDGRDEAMGLRVQEKSSVEFLEKLDQYAAHVVNSRFRPMSLRVGGHLITAEFIEQSFRKRQGLASPARLRAVAESIEHEVWLRHRYEVTSKERAAVKSSVSKMHRSPTLRTTYAEFFDWIERPDLFKAGRKSSLEFSDVFPLIYLKILLEGAPSTYRHVKHLVVDEMQDYTPVQYAVLSKLFPCDMTILGDVNQSINASSSSSAETICRVFRHAECVRLCKSYRSSYEITRFAQHISPNADLEAIERHGESPVIVPCRSKKEETEGIRRAITEFPGLGHRTLGIICKTQKQAEELYKSIPEDAPEVHLLTARSTAFVQGIVICSVHLAKGLEFDHVIVPNTSDANYATALERKLLYVACTRAMHRLVVSYVGTRTRFISEEYEASV